MPRGVQSPGCQKESKVQKEIEMSNRDGEKTIDLTNQIICSSTITPFQKRVYLELLNIPPGETITYGELARRIGCRSAQAVGQALKRNPFAPEVPCHRVVAANGTLGGYNGQRKGEQIELKRKLLEKEKGSPYKPCGEEYRSHNIL